MIQQTRPVTLAKNGVVCSPHYLSAQAGVNILQAGGNAIDAAIAANAVLNVVLPFGCSTGGDLFMIIYSKKDDAIYGLNASGRAPAAATPGWFKANGHATMPQRGILSVTVPGVVDGWTMASERFGKLGLAKSLQPAIGYAGDGFGVSPVFSRNVENVLGQTWCHPTWREHFAGNGVPKPGSIFKQPSLANTLALIAEKGREEYYKGAIARAIIDFSDQEGGLFTMDDFAEHHGDWVDPLSVSYKGYRIFEMPPNTQGIAALQMLKLVEKYHFQGERLDPQNIHILTEAKKIAFADRSAYLTDPDHMAVKPADLIDENYLAERSKLINPDTATTQAHFPGKVNQLNGDTIYLCAADGAGNLVSLIQSNYMGVGAGVVVPGLGIELQNRGAYFSLETDHANVIAPRKRTLHTLIPSMAFKDDKPAIVFGAMGGDGQAQTHLQVYTGLIDFGQNIQLAIDTPRWVDDQKQGVLEVENRFDPEVLSQLEAKGHKIAKWADFDPHMGFAQGIVINQENGLLMGGCDPRAESGSIGY